MNVFTDGGASDRTWKSPVCVQFIIRVAVLCALAGTIASPAAAQPADLLRSAREAATSGRRPDALNLLAAHLAASPHDVDARLLYGLVLSWEGQYDEARRHLQQVLVEAPAYTDARVALMNVEWWSGRTRAARDAAAVILSRDPGNEPARILRDRLDAAARPWWAGVSYSNDTFSDERSGWHEYALSLTRLTPRGSVILRASEARRFALDDRLIELEFYPRIRPGTYAFIGVGAAPSPTLYPSHRITFDLYQSLGRGVEVSGGVRRLGFDATTHIYVATMSKYAGNWMITGKVFHVPADGPLDSTSYHGGVRRYVRGDGASYVGIAYSHGFSREEIRDLSDLAALDSDTVRGETTLQLGSLRLFASGGASRQERQNRGALWQTSVTSGVMVQF